MNAAAVALARRWFEEVWNQRREATIDELLTPASICHAPGGELRGVESFRERVFLPFINAFPDLAVSVEGTVAEGDEVAVRWTARGTHAGPGLGSPATQRPILIRGMTWIRVGGGKLLEGWDCWNFRELIESLK